jgi:HK97 family phage portal protein
MGLFESLGASVKAVATSLAPAGNTPFSNWGGQGALVSGGTGYGPGGVGGGVSPGSRDNDFKDIGDLASNGIVSTCVSAISEAFVSAPPMLEQFDGKKWQRVDSHPLLDLLQNPNPFYGADHLWTATLAAEITTGNAFWRVVWNRARTQPVELWWEPHMWPNYDARVFIRDYTLRVDGKPHRIGAAANYDPRNAERIDHAIHFRYQIDRKNPRWGWTPLFAVLREIAGDNVASTYQTAVLKNGATASIFFSIKDGLGQGMTATQMEELVAGVERRLRREGAGRVAGTNLPVDLHKVGFSPEELALDRLPASYERRVCSNLKVPPMVVGLGAGEDTKTYANYGEAIDDFWQRTIIPAEERKGSELEAQLFRLFGMDRAEYRIVWDRSQIQALQEDESALFTRLEGASGGPFLTPNEAREKAKLPIVPGGEVLRLIAQPTTDAPPSEEIKTFRAQTSEESTPGSFAESPLAKAEKERLPKLRDAAREGKQEIAYLLDAETGEELSHDVGSETDVGTAASKGAGADSWAYIHSHTNEMPPSHQDWQALAGFPKLQIMIAITEKSRFSLAKSEGHQLEPFEGEMSERVKEEFLRDLYSGLEGAGFSAKNMPSEAELYPLVLKVNKSMAERFGVKFHVRSHPSEEQ